MFLLLARRVLGVSRSVDMLQVAVTATESQQQGDGQQTGQFSHGLCR